ncbi:sulfotransferase [Salegentibacter mishustinae]|nr:sulfotransferase [Salegentibacter mishustinae]GGW83520.1 hypothetical protein GCM10008086_09770 [Salegentibacter mishustinae]
MSKPNFLIVGAAKAGTTSAAKYLNEHPDIFIPNEKELRFFARKVLLNVSPKDPSINGILSSSVLDEDEYFKIFKDQDEKCSGEASVHYLYHHKEVIPEIKKYLGDIPILIFLREPTARAISNINYLFNTHRSNIEQEIAKENSRIRKGYNSFWYHKNLGLYSSQVEAYCKNFSKVKVVLFEDFVKDPQSILDEIHRFLNLSPFSLPQYYNYNENLDQRFFLKTLHSLRLTSLLKNLIPEKFFFSLKMKLFKRLFYKKRKLHPNKKTQDILQNFYKEDIIRLEKIIDRDLSSWRNKAL